ncbi:MAG TPA: hypothetical protein VF902_05660 [Coriobacteriia bacterium]
MNAVHIQTSRMRSAASSSQIKTEVERLPGVKSAHAFPDLALTSVLFDPEVTDEETIRARIARTGFGARVLVGGRLRHD